VTAERRQREGEVRVRHRIPRLESQRFFVEAGGLRVLALESQCDSEVQIGVRVVGLEQDGGLILRDRAIYVAAGKQRVSKRPACGTGRW
jgi:hypothetical protein